MAGKTRSLIGFYGGKNKMSHYIAEKLDYINCNAYLEMFGGGARVLLNKPRHKCEMYSDYSASLTALMRVISNPEQAVEFIHRVFDTGYSQQEFDNAKAVVDFVETDPMGYYEKRMREELKRLFVKYGMLNGNETRTTLDKLLLDEKSIVALKGHIALEGRAVQKDTYALLKELLSLYTYMKEYEITHNFLKRNQDYTVHNTYSDMDVAVATYVVYTQSRDNMGKYWSSKKFKDDGAYHRHMENLYDCAERMRNVNVYELDAMLFYRNFYSEQQGQLNEWLKNDGLMIYADPSYINPGEEEKLLDGIDWKNADSLGEKIRQAGKTPKNLGKDVYAMSFDYFQQEQFVKSIMNAECKMMVSNYDLKVYDKYLNKDTGWKKLYFETTTGVGNKAGNRRVECLWYNY